MNLGFCYESYLQSYHQNYKYLNSYLNSFIKIVFINIFVNIMHIVWILKALRLLKWFMQTPSLLLIKYWYFASYRSLAYRYILSMSGWFSIKFKNNFFSRSSVSYYWYSVWMIQNIWSIFSVFSFIFINIIIKVYRFLYLLLL